MQNTAHSTHGVPFKPHLNLMFSGHSEVTSVIKLQTRKPNREVCSYLGWMINASPYVVNHLELYRLAT